MCYMKRIVLLGLLACMGLSGFAQSPRWSEAQSKDWFKKAGMALWNELYSFECH